MRFAAARQYQGQRGAPASCSENGNFLHCSSCFLSNENFGSSPLANRRIFPRCWKITSAEIASEPRDTIPGGAKCRAQSKYTSKGIVAAAASEPSET